MADGYALDWDLSSAQAIDGAKVKIEPGIYPFRVVAFERMRHPGSAKIGPCPMARITIEVTGVELGSSDKVVTTTIKEDLKLWRSDFCEGLIGAFFRSMGFPPGPDGRTPVDWGAPLVGKTGLAEVDLHPFTTQDGQAVQANGVRRWVAPEDQSSAIGPQGLAPQQRQAPMPQAGEPYQQPPFSGFPQQGAPRWS